MRRRTASIFCAVLFTLVGLASDSPKEYDDTTIMDGLEGTWQIVASGLTHREVPPRQTSVQTYRGGKWVYTQNGRIIGEGTYKVEMGRIPATLDEMTTYGPGNVKTARYLYRLNGDTLRTAFRQPGNVRPRSFDEDGLFIVIWKRVRK